MQKVWIFHCKANVHNLLFFAKDLIFLALVVSFNRFHLFTNDARQSIGAKRFLKKSVCLPLDLIFARLAASLIRIFGEFSLPPKCIGEMSRKFRIIISCDKTMKKEERLSDEAWRVKTAGWEDNDCHRHKLLSCQSCNYKLYDLWAAEGKFFGERKFLS